MSSSALRLVLLWCLATTLGSAVAAKPVAGQKDSDPPTPRIEVLMRQLDDDQFWVREEASRELWKIGEKALPKLRELVDSKNPEQAIRARELIRKIELDVAPDSDPELIELVQRYGKALVSERPKILNRLREIRAWRQMLRLYAGESDPNILRAYAKSVHQIALFAAREQLRARNPQAAKELLELMPANAETLMSLADFHRSQGTLQAELERQRGRPGKQAAAWRLALYRAAGDLEKARAEAELADEAKIAAALAAMGGDPLPWIKLMTQPSTRGSDLVEQYYARAAIDRWHGERPNSQYLEKLKSMLTDRNIQLQLAARNALLLLGQNEMAEAAMVKADPIPAFWHLCSLERVEDALAILGLDANSLRNPEWVSKRIAAIDKLSLDDSGQRNPENELLAFAAFLETRGLIPLAQELFAVPLLELAAKDEHVFLDFLSQLNGARSGSHTSAPMLTKSVGVRWAADDDDKWISLVAALFDADELASSCWNWLAELKPEASRGERLDALYALMGLGPDPKGLRERWLRIAWQKHEQADDAGKAEIRKQIAQIAIESGDVTNSLKVWNLDPELRSQAYWGQLVTYLSAAERWQETSQIIVDQLKELEKSENYNGIEFHAYASVALRNSGREEEARAHDELLESLILGDANVALQVGNGYAFGHDYERAELWWERSARYASPDSNQFVSSVLCYSDHLLLDPEQWTRTAALAEIICASLNGVDFRWESNPLAFMRQRMKSDMCRGLSRIESNRAAAIRALDQMHASSITEGGLADFFFPAVRAAGLLEEHDRWFAATWQKMQEVLGRYPDATNTCNSAAWFAARAQRQLEAAETYLRRSLEMYPQQAAYLDTMAEIQFARGDRRAALEWSKKAILMSPDDKELRLQHQHFKSDPLPAKR